MKTHLKAILIVLLAALCLAGMFVFDILELPVIVLPSAYPADFSIRYESSIYGQKIVLDTSAGIVERGGKTASFTPGEALLRQIWTMVLKTKLPSIREFVSGNESSHPTFYKITCTMNGQTYTVAGIDPFGSAKRECKHLSEFVRFIEQKLETIPEFQSLPKGNGIG